MGGCFGVAAVCYAHMHAVCVVSLTAEQAFAAWAGYIDYGAVSNGQPVFFSVLGRYVYNLADKFMTYHFGQLHGDFAVIDMYVRSAYAACLHFQQSHSWRGRG